MCVCVCVCLGGGGPLCHQHHHAATRSSMHHAASRCHVSRSRTGRQHRLDRPINAPSSAPRATAAHAMMHAARATDAGAGFGASRRLVIIGLQFAWRRATDAHRRHCAAQPLPGNHCKGNHCVPPHLVCSIREDDTSWCVSMLAATSGQQRGHRQGTMCMSPCKRPRNQRHLW